MSEIEKILQTKPTFTPTVVAFLVEGEKVLLIERIKTSNGLGEGNLAGVGGKVGDEEHIKDETIEEALVREVQEEIKILATAYRCMGNVKFLYENDSEKNMKMAVYRIDRWKGTPQKTEVAVPDWHLISNLPTDRMFTDAEYWLLRALNGELINATFLFDENHKVKEYTGL